VDEWFLQYYRAPVLPRARTLQWASLLFPPLPLSVRTAGSRNERADSVGDTVVATSDSPASRPPTPSPAGLCTGQHVEQHHAVVITRVVVITALPPNPAGYSYGRATRAGQLTCPARLRSGRPPGGSAAAVTGTSGAGPTGRRPGPAGVAGGGRGGRATGPCVAVLCSVLSWAGPRTGVDCLFAGPMTSDARARGAPLPNGRAWFGWARAAAH